MPPFSKNSTPFWSMGKCLLGAALVLSTSLTFLPSVQAEVTSEDLLIVNGGDVPANHWAAESVRLAIDKYKFLSGYPDKRFRGDKTLTRYEMAALLYQWAKRIEMSGTSLRGKNMGKTYENMLYENGGDIDRTHWAAEGIQAVVDKYQLIGGYPDGTFRGARTLSRFEMVSIYSNMLKALSITQKGTNARFEKSLKNNGGDVDASHWAAKDFELVLSHGIMNLYDNRYFKGNNSLTRYELVYSLVQASELIERKQRGESIFADQLAQNPTPNQKDRVALVIGNASYKTAGVLKNPLNDAKDMAQTLKQIGFHVIHKENLATRKDMLDVIRNEFGKSIKPKGAALFYYAGHGIQINGQNYLVPTQANMKNEAEKEANSLSLDFLFQTLTDTGSETNLILLDACRNNPYAQKSSTNGNRGIQIAPNKAYQGLANLNSSNIPIGTFISYATAAGETAADGAGRNGLYTQELLKALQKKGMEIEDVDKEVRKNVRKLSGGKQIPWQTSNLESDFIMHP